MAISEVELGSDAVTAAPVSQALSPVATQRRKKINKYCFLYRGRSGGGGRNQDLLERTPQSDISEIEILCKASVTAVVLGMWNLGKHRPGFRGKWKVLPRHEGIGYLDLEWKHGSTQLF